MWGSAFPIPERDSQLCFHGDAGGYSGWRENGGKPNCYCKDPGLVLLQTPQIWGTGSRERFEEGKGMFGWDLPWKWFLFLGAADSRRHVGHPKTRLFLRRIARASPQNRAWRGLPMGARMLPDAGAHGLSLPWFPQLLVLCRTSHHPKGFRDVLCRRHRPG